MASATALSQTQNPSWTHHSAHACKSELEATSKTKQADQRRLPGSSLAARVPVGEPSSAPSAFMQLPLEIRLRIFHWVHVGNNVQADSRSPAAAAMPPTFSPPTLSTTFWLLDLGYRWGGFSGSRRGDRHVCRFRAVVEEGAGTTTVAKPAPVRLLSPFRPSGRVLPSALLCTCRQVYHEARRVPFCASEFVFVRCLSSGLSTAHAFVVLGSRGAAAGRRCWLQPWQRDSMRYVRLELELAAADVGWGSGEWEDGDEDGSRGNSTNRNAEQRPTSTGLDQDAWTALCRSWSQGLQGLRLTLAITASPVDRQQQQQPKYTPSAVADCPLASGLKRLQMLRQLEVELVFSDGSVWHRPGGGRGRKRTTWREQGENRNASGNELELNRANTATHRLLAWCAALETGLNRQTAAVRDGCQRPVRVVCVERIVSGNEDEEETDCNV